MLTDPTFWRDLAARVGRQVVQTLIPVLTMALTTGSIVGLDYSDLFLTAALTGAVTLLRALTGVRAPAGAPLWLDGVDRALAAAAGTGLSLVTAEHFDFVRADWTAIGGAVLASACLSVLAMFTNTPQPPVVVVEPQGDAPSPLNDPIPEATILPVDGEDAGPVIYDYSSQVDTTRDDA